MSQGIIYHWVRQGKYVACDNPSIRELGKQHFELFKKMQARHSMACGVIESLTKEFLLAARHHAASDTYQPDQF